MTTVAGQTSRRFRSPVAGAATDWPPSPGAGPVEQPAARAAATRRLERRADGMERLLMTDGGVLMLSCIIRRPIIPARPLSPAPVRPVAALFPAGRRPTGDTAGPSGPLAARMAACPQRAASGSPVSAPLRCGASVAGTCPT
jgi:hypothetical protein